MSDPACAPKRLRLSLVWEMARLAIDFEMGSVRVGPRAPAFAFRGLAQSAVILLASQGQRRIAFSNWAARYARCCLSRTDSSPIACSSAHGPFKAPHRFLLQAANSVDMVSAVPWDPAPTRGEPLLSPRPTLRGLSDSIAAKPGDNSHRR